MQINSVSNISFKNRIKINMPDKSLCNKNYYDGPLGKVIQIADKNNANLCVGEDVVILNSSPGIENDLKQAGFNFEEIKDEIGVK